METDGEKKKREKKERKERKKKEKEDRKVQEKKKKEKKEKRKEMKREMAKGPGLWSCFFNAISSEDSSTSLSSLGTFSLKG